MTPAIRLSEMYAIRVLTTRASARILRGELDRALQAGRGHAGLDFAGIDGITPSFLDEVLTVLEEAAAAGGHDEFELKVLNPPTRLSSKFEAVGRGHRLSIHQTDAQTWSIIPETLPVSR